MSKIKVDDIEDLVGKKVINQDGIIGVIALVRKRDKYPLSILFDNGKRRTYTSDGYMSDMTSEYYITLYEPSVDKMICDDISSLLGKYNLSSEELIAILLENYH